MDDLSIVNWTNGLLKRNGQSVTIYAMTPSDFKKSFTGRVRQVRESTGKTREEFAVEMGVEKETWIKYESRTPIPHHLIPRFCRLTGADIHWIFTGEPVKRAAVRPQLPTKQRVAR